MRRIRAPLTAVLIAGSLVLGSCGTGPDDEPAATDETAADEPVVDQAVATTEPPALDGAIDEAFDEGPATTDTTAGQSDQPDGDGGQLDALAMAADIGDIDLSEDEARLVAVEAAWLCRAQRFSFGDPGEMTAARDELLAANDVTAEQYAAFTSELANRLELREAVLAEFATSCLGSE